MRATSAPTQCVAGPYRPTGPEPARERKGQAGQMHSPSRNLASEVPQLMPLFDPDNPLAAEIKQEMAESYFAACRKMVDSLEALRAFDRAVASATRDNERLARRSELLEDAAERVHFVVIQREAMQLSGYKEFFEDYEVPDEVRTRLGPRRSK